jgi:hypothetical protein
MCAAVTSGELGSTVAIVLLAMLQDAVNQSRSVTL